MTAIASYLDVFAFQPILGVFVMRKDNIFPLFGRMAILTFLAVASVVYVVDPVTGDAIHRDILVAFIRMTTFTSSLFMLSF